MSTEDPMRRSMEAAKGLTAPGEPPASVVSGPANIARTLKAQNKGAVTKPLEIEDVSDVPLAFRFAFLGTGQGGSKMAAAAHELGYRRVAVFNTTSMDFKDIDEQIARLSLDIGGAKKDAAFAAAQLNGREEEVHDLFVRAWGKKIDYAFICAGLGGGTGSGTVGLLAELARKYLAEQGHAAKVGAIVSLPQPAEGQQICRNAVYALKGLISQKISPLIILDNGRINDLYEQPGFAELYPMANKAVTHLLNLFNQVAANRNGVITFDHSELAQLLDDGVVVMGGTDFALDSIKTPADISTKIRDEFGKSVLASVDLRTGTKAACIFIADKDALKRYSIDFFEAGFNQLNRILGTGRGGEVVPVVHRGVYEGADAGLQCYVMVSGLEPPLELLRKLAASANIGDNARGVELARFLGLE